MAERPAVRHYSAPSPEEWAWILGKIDDELGRLGPRAAGGFRGALLRGMRDAAAARDEALLVDAGEQYLRRTRVVPPGIYASCDGPGKGIYLDGERLEPGKRDADLTLGALRWFTYR